MKLTSLGFIIFKQSYPAIKNGRCRCERSECSERLLQHWIHSRLHDLFQRGGGGRGAGLRSQHKDAYPEYPFAKKTNTHLTAR